MVRNTTRGENDAKGGQWHSNLQLHNSIPWCCRCADSKVKAALWEVHAESHPFTGASRHSVGKEHDEHTAGLDVFSLEITPAEEALINKLKANANPIKAYLESSPQVSISLERGLLSAKHCIKAVGV